MNINFYRIDPDGNYHEFSLIHYLSIKSFHECYPYASIILYSNRPIVSRWFILLKSELGNSLTCRYVDYTEVDQVKYQCASHFVDHLKLKHLFNEGGLVVDTDMISISPISFDLTKVNISEERDPLSHHFTQLAMGLVYSDKNNQFIDDWLTEYNNYHKDCRWTEFCGEVPTKLWQSGKYDINIIPECMIDPYTYTRDKLRDLFMHKKSIGDAWCIHVAESIAWDRYLKPLDIEHIMTVDTTFTLAVRKYVEHLWDKDTQCSKICY